MTRLALRMLRHRPGPMVGTFVAIFFGSALVLSFGALMETGIRGDVPPQRLSAAAVVVTGVQQFAVPEQDPATVGPDDDRDFETANLPERARVDAELVNRIAAIPGVRAAIGDLSFPVAMTMASSNERIGAVGAVAAQGHPASSIRLGGYHIAAGSPPQGPGQVMIGADAAATGIAIGDRLRLVVAGVEHRVEVAAIVAPPAASSTTSPTAGSLYFADDVAAQLSGHPGRWDAIGVIAAPQADTTALAGQVADIAGGSASALTGNDRGRAEFVESLAGSSQLIIVASVSGGLSITIAMFVVFSTLALAIQQRQSDLALLRAIGTTPRQLRRMVVVEAGLIAAVAGGLGWIPGRWLGRGIFDQMAGHGAVPEVISYRQGWIPIVVAVGAGILTAVVAGFVAARRAAVAHPTEALAEAAVERRWLTKARLIIAGLCLGGGIALIIVTLTVFDGPIAASTAGPSVMLWAFALAMIAPGATRMATVVLQWPARLFGSAGYLAVANSRSRPVRMAAAVTPIMLTTGLATGMIYLQTTQVAAGQQVFASSLQAEAVVSAGAGGLPADALRRVDAAPEVGAVSEFVTSTVYIDRPYYGGQDSEGLPAQGLTAAGAAAVVGTPVVDGSLDRLVGNAVAVPAEVADDTGLSVGSTLTLRYGDGSTRDAEVVALTEGRAGFEQTVLLPAATLAAHTTSGRAGRILVRPAAGTDPAALTAALRSATAALPGVQVAGRDAILREHEAGQQTGAWVNYLIVAVMVLYTAIALVNSQIMATVRRRREFGLQRLAGAHRGQVLRMTIVEAALAAVIGIGLGTLLSATTLVPFSLLVTDSVLPTGPLWIYLAIAGSAAALCLVATLLPAWRVSGVRPVEAATAE